MDVSALRQSYQKGRLDESDAGHDPHALFARWFEEARALPGLEPNAATLATADVRGRPSARTLLLKSFDSSGLVFFTNYDSRKGNDLAENPQAALLFFWAPLERQVRVEGQVVKVSHEESDAYYRVRPLGSRIGAWASRQSSVIASREELEASVAAAEAAHGDDPQRPPNWGGYRLLPDTWEFWQGRDSRLHDRIRFRLRGGQWVRERLAP